ncbi:threonine synthase [Thermococcus chitonophagus]|uniref:Threonine synthase n=1 Tax=Thermococcus chitonophagus TaxID=54262 RepID=A0A160VUE1_9EURY|nr:pyridoxal-phosphate dependent enzyme [Thermococcus chitonophagus]ASJ16967.1 threonine synthase [Thermococcus chitonophagus]CUX78449.1 Threonine synthase [Thermococcus chitonophagus]
MKCPRCGREYVEVIPPFCICGQELEITYDYSSVDVRKWRRRIPGVWRYKELLPPVKRIISLREGGTPLIKARISEKLGIDVYIKDETRNPTGSFRDRLATVAVSYGLPYTTNGFIIASDGNAAASVAAYSARAEKEAFVVVPKKVDKGKLIQMIAFGARIIRYGESVDDAIEYARELARLNGLYNVTPEDNIVGLEGQKTIAYELWEEMTPTHVIVPTGSGSYLYSIYKGFKELSKIGVLREMPRLIAVQVEKCNPIAAEILGVEKSCKEIKALGLYVRNPIMKSRAIEAIKESNGTAVIVSEEDIDLGEKLLANEGIFAELSSAVVMPALLKLVEEGFIEKGDKPVLVVTGSGLKTGGGGREKFSIGGTKLDILKVLKDTEMYAYEIWKALGKPLKYQAVHQHIKELLELGLIEEAYRRGKRIYYRLTEKGARLVENFES